MNKNKLSTLMMILIFAIMLFPTEVLAETLPGINLQVNPTDNPEQVVGSLQLLAILTVLTLAPAFIMMMTSFTRIVIVLGFVRNALATQQAPPNQVIIGLALFLTFFTMAPVYETVKADALDPYLAGTMPQELALENATVPIKDFMMKQTREKDLALFIKMSEGPRPATKKDVSLSTLIPAFIVSELKTAFQMGFLIFIPFLVIDMVVASTLMSMGMVMVPPIMISLPFKLLLFVITDGWYLVAKSLLEGFV